MRKSSVSAAAFQGPSLGLRVKLRHRKACAVDCNGVPNMTVSKNCCTVCNRHGATCPILHDGRDGPEMFDLHA